MDNKKVIAALNTILEHELGGVVRYTHYSLMVFVHNRIPIVKWLHEQATESLSRAREPYPVESGGERCGESVSNRKPARS